MRSRTASSRSLNYIVHHRSRQQPITFTRAILELDWSRCIRQVYRVRQLAAVVVSYAKCSRPFTNPGSTPRFHGTTAVSPDRLGFEGFKLARHSRLGKKGASNTAVSIAAQY